MDNNAARVKMVEQQVRAWDVFDPEVLDVLGEIPRENFVPEQFRALAFADTEIPIGHNQAMMTPTIEGRVLQALELDGTERVLEIGTGSGFLTACLAQLSDRVTSVELYDGLLESARERLGGIDKVELLQMDAMASLPSGRFDAIAVTGSLQQFDPRFVEALSPGGRLFVVVGDAPVMDARLVRHNGDNDWLSESLFETALAPLVHAVLPPMFSF